MTYILGIKSGGVGAIISDTMVTFDRGDHNFSALKTGLLFPGCCYGAAGDAGGIRHFVMWCKQRLNGVEDTVAGFWSRFQTLVSTYDFEKYESFELLLLSRSNGFPCFYVLDSRTATLTQAGDFVSLGSGKSFLDEHMRKFYEEEHAHREEGLIQKGWPAFYWPYYYCQELMSFSQGHNYDALHKLGVGGVFHYLYQKADAEHVQEAAIYAVISVFGSKKQFTYTILRVLFGQMALVVENGATNEACICIDTAVFPKIENYDKAKLSELQEQITSDVHKQPYCRFAGFVFADPKYQGVTFDWIRGDDAQLPISADGKIHKSVQQAVEQIIERVELAV
jgi:hypothetical protein